MLIDDLNIVFIVLTFVGFTTSIFSASYIAHELEASRLTPVYLRFYHAMYQTMMFGMNLAFVSNNIGLMWVAVELATLTTVLMVGIYRTHAALEAAWKYFILGSVEPLALFRHDPGLYGGASGHGRRPGRHGLDAAGRTRREFRRGPSQCCLRIPVSRLRHKVGLAPLHAWLPDAASPPRRRSRPCYRASC